MKTVAPKTSIWAILASGAEAGTKMTARLPALAHTPDSAAAALPVLAVETTDAPISWARATTIALARSFSEAVGLRPSSLIHSDCIPSDLARYGASMSGD